MKRLLLLVTVCLLVGSAPASAARVGVGVLPGWSAEKLARRIEAATGARPWLLIPGAALAVEVAHPGALRGIRGVAYVESLAQRRRLAFVTNDPLAPRQWYLQNDRAFDFWPDFPQLPAVRVAIVDSGIDGGHPDLQGRVVAAKSFVGGSPYTDADGHGTFVAGEIAAAPDNGVGIAGLAFPAQLVIAKVVNSNDELPLEAEVAGIRWAVQQGARVINLSLGGVRDPLDPKLDTYSPLEQAAIDYAARKGAVVVAAVGNGPQSPKTPWPYAHYPAALPHVIGVSAITQSGSVPGFSNRDAVYNDLAAPGEAILSTVPREQTQQRPSCSDQGYSPCGSPEFRDAIGTSFAAPQVAAAAALVLAVRPDLRPEQVANLLERSAVDANPESGCKQCPVGRDAFTGWGALDVQGALEVASAGGPFAPRDAYEANDDAGPWAYPLWGPKGRTVAASLDYWDDQVDVYSLVLRKGQRLYARLGGGGTDLVLDLWKPGTQHVLGLAARLDQR
ncbi:MAG: S8 family peptidase, partial [Gaiellaceae bacterium]